METIEPSTATEDTTVETDSPSMLPVDQRASSHSPLRPGSTLLAYQPNGNTSPKTPARLGKSQHLAQIRSLGLLHDLQDYISSVETLASDQKRELERVREEKRDMEKYMARNEAYNQERMMGVVDFSSSEVADLPPRMRALVEDNRGLRELVKRYKLRTTSLEHQVAQLQSQVLALAEANERLKQSLSECSRTPNEVEREDTLRRQMELKNRQLENLEHGMGVLRGKVETDTKLYRQNLAAAAREKDALKRQLVAANKSIEERDKEVRGLNLELRKLRRGAAPTRGGGPYHPPGGAGADDDGSGAGPAALASAASSKAPKEEVEERIRIMLIIVRDEVQVPVVVHVPVPVVVETPGTPMEGNPGEREGEQEASDPAELAARLQAQLEGAEEAAREPQPETEPEPDSAPEPAPEPEGELDPTPHPEPSSDPAAEPAPQAEPESEPAPEPSAEGLPEATVEAEPAPEPADEAPPEPEAEPSSVGLLGEASAGGEVTLAGEVGEGGEGDDGAAEASVESEAAAAAPEVQPDAPEPELQPGAEPYAMHSHASPPMPVPYARTAARALATKVGGGSGGASVKYLHAPPHPPHPPLHGPSALALPAGSTSHRKHSGGGLGGAGSVSTKGGGAGGLRAVGATSRKHAA